MCFKWLLPHAKGSHWWNRCYLNQHNSAMDPDPPPRHRVWFGSVRVCFNNDRKSRHTRNTTSTDVWCECFCQRSILYSTPQPIPFNTRTPWPFVDDGKGMTHTPSGGTTWFWQFVMVGVQTFARGLTGQCKIKSRTRLGSINIRSRFALAFTTIVTNESLSLAYSVS